MIRNGVISLIALTAGIGGAGAVLSPTVAGGPQLERPTPSVVRIGARAYNAANVLVGGARVQETAFVRGDRSWLPARAILSRLGGGVEWAPAERAFYAKFAQQGIVERIAVGSRTATVFRFDPARPHQAGATVRSESLPAAPFIHRGHVYTPLRGLVEAVGGRLSWYPESRTVYVTLPPRVGVPAP